MSDRINGGAQRAAMQVNPSEVARIGLAFMQRVSFTAAERQGFDAVEALLQAIAQGQVQIIAAPSPPVLEASLPASQ